MNKKLSTRGERSGNGLVESVRGGDGLGLPDYESWEGLGESSKSLLGRIVDAMAERPISELAVIVAQIGLIILARDIVKASGGGLPPPQGFIAIMVLALMIWAPALYHPIILVVRKRNHAKNRKRAKEATKPRNDRGGAPKAGSPAGEDGRR